MRRASLLGTVRRVLAGCSGGIAPPRLDAGAIAYRAGEPAFVLDAVATLRDGESGIDIYLGLPPASVVHRQSGGAFVGVARWTVTVESEGEPPVLLTPVDTLRGASGEAAASEVPGWRVERADVPPGRYVVRAVLEDRASERTAERLVEVEVRTPGASPSLGSLRFEGVGLDGRTGPVDAAAVPAGLDSLRVVVQALGLPEEAVTTLTVDRVQADTAAASSLFDFTPSPVSLVARGIDGSETEPVQTVRQPVSNPDEALDVLAPLPSLRPGVYRVRIDLEGPAGAALATAERLIVVRRRDYPRVTRLGDLIAPLVYLADDREMEALRSAEDPGAMQRAFDRFWGARLDDRRLAASTVRAYYERVEEANRLFGTYKEGWKTDPGMVYILFGPPRYVESTPEVERWIYGAGSASAGTLVFERTAGRPGQRSAFSVLTLTRDRSYGDLWRHVRRQWRTGVVS